MLFDTHCHINDSAYDTDRPDVLARAAEAGVGLMLCPATDMATSQACIDLANGHDGVYAAVGIHPEAHGDTLDILRQYGKGIRGVFHCYSGSLEMTAELLRMGFYFGFDGPLTYPNSKRARRVAENLPLDRILIETDSPYLTPQAHRGQHNEPAYVRYVAEELAALRGIRAEEAVRITAENGRRLFNL